jgi:hypothetical protein
MNQTKTEAAEKAAGVRGGAWQQNPPSLVTRVKLVYAHNVILHVRLADMKIRYAMRYGIPLWAKDLIDYVEKHGRHKKVKRPGYSRFWRGIIMYENDEYEMEMSVAKLVELITATDKWKKSPIAREIIEK